MTALPWQHRRYPRESNVWPAVGGATIYIAGQLTTDHSPNSHQVLSVWGNESVRVWEVWGCEDLSELASYINQFSRYNFEEHIFTVSIFPHTHLISIGCYGKKGSSHKVSMVRHFTASQQPQSTVTIETSENGCGGCGPQATPRPLMIITLPHKLTRETVIQSTEK